MEKKKLHRLVGIFIIIALLIIISPLFFKNDMLLDKSDIMKGNIEDNQNKHIEDANMESDSGKHEDVPENAINAISNEFQPLKDTSKEDNIIENTPVNVSENTITVNNPLPPTINLPSDTTEQVVTADKEPSDPIVIINKPWLVQVGTFKNHFNAIRLANRIKSAGFTVFTKQIVSKTGNISTLVYIGPVSSKSKAHDIFVEIDNKFKLQGILIPQDKAST